jgi:hypothetical protein
MPSVPQITKEELRRLQAWQVCLRDARAYLALARRKDEILREDLDFVVGETGNSYFIDYGHFLEKGLVAAAIVSAGQIFKSGYVGTGIAGNHSAKMEPLRTLLYQCSDKGNGWREGKSEKRFEELVTRYRNGHVSHFEGKAAEITETENGFSWKGPNPWFDASAFADLENILDQMDRSLRQYVSEQSKLLGLGK